MALYVNMASFFIHFLKIFLKTTRFVVFAFYLCAMEKKLSQIIRYLLIVRKLTQHRGGFVTADELIDHLEEQMLYRDVELYGCTVRTLQRDFKKIQEIFGITIKHRRACGYFISEEDSDNLYNYEQMLLDFDLLTAIGDESKVSEYLIPEHHYPQGHDNIPAFIQAIKNREELCITYHDVRRNKEYQKTVYPHFLKESLGQWYLVAVDTYDNKIKTLAINRIVDFYSKRDNAFKRRTDIDIEEMYRDCYGVWNDPNLPVEEVILSYKELDAYFIKKLPLHRSQEILVDDGNEVRIKVRVRITKDFIMALLARSRSLTVISPQYLREEICKIYEEAAQRNK